MASKRTQEYFVKPNIY